MKRKKEIYNRLETQSYLGRWQWQNPSLGCTWRMNVEQFILEGQPSGGLIHFFIEARFPPEWYSQHLEYSFHVYQLATLHLLSFRPGFWGFLMVISSWQREPISFRIHCLWQWGDEQCSVLLLILINSKSLLHTQAVFSKHMGWPMSAVSW